MGKALIGKHLEHEANLATVSSAGWRFLVEASVSITNATEDTYTITRPEAKRVLIVTTDADVKIDLNETATSGSLPLLANQYIVFSVEEGDVLHFFNDGGGPETVFIAELR